jgi:hypothetical protein
MKTSAKIIFFLLLYFFVSCKKSTTENSSVYFERSNDSIQNYLLNRSPYILHPGKAISFDLYADIVDGDWHVALQKCF